MSKKKPVETPSKELKTVKVEVPPQKSESVTITNKLFQAVSFTILDSAGKQQGRSLQAKGSMVWPRCDLGFDVSRLCRAGALVIS